MIIAIEIESTETCPFNYRVWPHEIDLCSERKPEKWLMYGNDELPCLGLESPDCPCNRIRCETCGQTKHCFIYCHLREELINVPEMVCGNWLPIKESE